MKPKRLSMIVSLALAVCSILVPPNSFAQENSVGYISFSYLQGKPQDGNTDIFIIDKNGENLQRLTHHPAGDGSATWAPDGRAFAFASNRDGNPEIYVMDLNQRKTRRLTNHPARDEHPAWSPDGKWIVFASARDRNDPFKYDLYKIEPNGDNLQRLTKTGETNTTPAWSPDGRQIAFYSSRNERHDIHIMDANGQNIKHLVPIQGHERLSPSWSPNGKKLTYASNFFNVDGTNIYIMDIDGRNSQRLTPPETWDGEPVWSPDGEWIAYRSELDSPFDNPDRDMNIYLIRPDGTDRRQVTHLPGMLYTPRWVPEGFLSVSPTAETQTTLWGRLKQAAEK